MATQGQLFGAGLDRTPPIGRLTTHNPNSHNMWFLKKARTLRVLATFVFDVADSPWSSIRGSL